MIVFWMATFVIAAVAAAIETLRSSRHRLPSVAVLGGLAAGGLVFNSTLYWSAFPWFSIGLYALALVVAVVVVVTQRPHLRRAAAATAGAAAVPLLGWHVALIGILSIPTVSPVETTNADGDTGHALIVYHDGASGFQNLITGELARRLADNGWRVDRVTASDDAPTDLDDVDVLVLSTPTYNWGEVARPVRDYLNRLGTPSVPVVTITTAVGYIAHHRLDEQVVRQGGTVLRSIDLFTTAPNSDQHGTNDQRQIMRDEADTITDLIGAQS
jgi:hypothetical protein